MTENVAISAIDYVASVTILIIKLVIGTSCMLRLSLPIRPKVLTSACFKHSWKGIPKNGFGVTAMLSYEQVSVRQRVTSDAVVSARANSQYRAGLATISLSQRRRCRCTATVGSLRRSIREPRIAAWER